MQWKSSQKQNNVLMHQDKEDKQCTNTLLVLNRSIVYILSVMEELNCIKRSKLAVRQIGIQLQHMVLIVKAMNEKTNSKYCCGLELS